MWKDLLDSNDFVDHRVEVQVAVECLEASASCAVPVDERPHFFLDSLRTFACASRALMEH